MPDEVVSIARVPLARAPKRLLAAPLLATAVGIGTVAVGALVGGWAGIGLVLAGLVTVALAAWLAVILLTVRLDVEVSAVRVHWLGGERRFALVRGPVTRVAMRGPDAVPFRARFGAFGWVIGRATLRRQERIEVVRLAPTDTVIVVPTEGRRLALAPRSESELIEALTLAARVQQRLDAARPRLPLPIVAPEPVPVAPPPAPEPVEEPAPRVLTGIERVELEQRLAMQRAAALAAAEAERRAQEEARAAAVVAPAVAPAPAPRRLPSFERPAWARPTRADFVGLGILLVPTLLASAGWLYALATGLDHQPTARQLGMALVLAGPIATLGAIAARFWWPRLATLVLSSAVFALALVAGGLVGRV